MQYDLKIRESATPVDVTPADERGATTLTEGGAARALTLAAVTPHHLRVTEGGRGHDVFVARTPDGTWVWSAGRARLVQDAAAQKTARRGAGGAVGQSVTPPMPAVVQAVLVAVGDEVAKSQKLVVVSAMKMESTLVAPYAGTVTAINTEVGAKVNPGDVLVEIDPADQGGDDD